MPQGSTVLHLARRAFKFALTGLFVTGVHVALAIALMEFSGVGPGLANGTAFASSALLSYAINTVWSFSEKPGCENLRRFVAVSALGGVLAVAVAEAVADLGHGYLSGIVVVALTVPPVTFLLHSRWTYARYRRSDQSQQ